VKTRATDEEIKVSLLFFINPSVPLKLGTDPYFFQAKQLAREKLTAVIGEMASILKARMQATLKKDNVCLAIDGEWRRMQKSTPLNTVC